MRADGSGRGRLVEAAGGVVVRPAPAGAAGVAVENGDAAGVEVLLVHRPRYDDWTFPKGKAEPGELPAETARREVLEETGYECTVGAPLTEVRYVDDRGRPKVVRYFHMTVERGAFAANEEVDAIAWCVPAEAAARLTYAHDVEVLRATGPR